jgi:hypothetical protein
MPKAEDSYFLIANDNLLCPGSKQYNIEIVDFSPKRIPDVHF